MLPLIADVAHGAVQVAQELALEVEAAVLLLPEVVAHHVVQGGRRGQFRAHKAVELQGEYIVHTFEFDPALVVVANLRLQPREGQTQTLEHVERTLGVLDLLQVPDRASVRFLHPRKDKFLLDVEKRYELEGIHRSDLRSE